MIACHLHSIKLNRAFEMLASLNIHPLHFPRMSECAWLRCRKEACGRRVEEEEEKKIGGLYQVTNLFTNCSTIGN